MFFPSDRYGFLPSRLISNFRTRYRDLLGTAETIVEMNVQIQEVEVNLSEMGRRCNTKLIDKKSALVNRLRHDVLESSMIHSQNY
jgi:hypothetical protein